jgi:hypothetical protein
MRIEYHPSIEAELAEIRDFYNERSRNLGDDFINEFERAVLRIAAMPTRWMIVRGDTRRALMKRFPYLILFRIVDDSVLRFAIMRRCGRISSPASNSRLLKKRQAAMTSFPPRFTLAQNGLVKLNQPKFKLVSLDSDKRWMFLRCPFHPAMRVMNGMAHSGGSTGLPRRRRFSAGL